VTDWIRAGLTILFGAAAGGLTNRVAVWMLFHPHRPPELFGRRLGWLQGAIPKNHDRLAASVGRTVGDRLLTPEDLAEALEDRELADAFRDRLRRLLERLLEEDHPPLRELLPPEAGRELRRLCRRLAEEARPRLARSLAEEELAGRLATSLATLVETLEREGGELPPVGAGMEALRTRAEEWLRRVAESEAFERTVREELESAARRLLRPGRALEDVVPDGAASALEAAVADYLPLAMEQLGRLLEDRDARRRFERAVHELLERFMEDLRFHQRVVARLIITEETVERVLATLEEEGAERLGEVLREEDVQAAMARRVNEGVRRLLRRPATEVLGEADGERVRGVLRSTEEWILRTARDPGTRRLVLDRIERAARRRGERGEPTWAEVVRRLPAGRIGEWAAALLRSEAGEAMTRAAADGLAEAVLARPLERPGRLLGPAPAERLTETLGPPIWEWIAGEIPTVAARVRVAERVEEKIRSYPLADLERLVRSVTQRELDLIVRLGYFLGAFIGAALALADALIG